MSGWIKLHRQFKTNGHFHMPDRALKIWLYILMTVSHRDQPRWGIESGEGWISYDMIAEDCAEHPSRRVRREAVANALKYLEDHGYIEREIEPGKGQKIRVVNWHKYQGDESGSDTSCETEPGETSSESMLQESSSETELAKFRNGTTTGTDPSSETEPLPEPIQECKEPSNKKRDTPPISPPQSSGVAYPDEFEQFWSVYPRKLKKRDAFRRWVAAQKRSKNNTDPATAVELLAAAQNYARACLRKGTDMEYIMHPTTFLSLRSRAWEDYVAGIPEGDQSRSLGLYRGTRVPGETPIDRRLRELGVTAI